MKKHYRYSKKKKRASNELMGVQIALLVGGLLIVYREFDTILSGEFPSLSTLLMGIGLSLVVLGVPYLIRSIKRTQHTKEYRNSSLYQIDKMDGIEFERYLKWLFEQRGYKASTTQTTNDFGADLILTKDGKKIVVQAKRYGSNVGIQAIQEVFTAQHYFDCDEAWVVTNSRYTKSARLVGDKLSVRLIGRDELNSFVSPENKEQPETIQAYKKSNVGVPRDCPKCGSQLAIRKSKTGEFYGCTTYPSCKHTEKI